VKLTVIGFQSPYPELHQATPGYLLEDVQGTKILIDCGSGVASSLPQWAELTSLDAILLSHYHNDHVADVGIFHYAYLMEQIQGRRRVELPILGPSEPVEKAKIREYKDVTLAVDIKEHKDYEIGSFTVSFFQTDHDGPCYGMRISNGESTLVYGADSGPKTDWSVIKEPPDLLILESTYIEEYKNPEVKHLSAKDAAFIANELGAKKLLLTHLFPGIESTRYYSEARPYFPGEVYMAEKGLQINV
jgi:ribonuclease BN (tRNA processing enzyme)